MGLFNSNNGGCCCNNINANMIKKMEKYENESFIILGSGSDECKQLEENLTKVLKENNIEEHVEHISEQALISMYGVMKTPALVIKQNVVSIGKVLDVNEIKELVKKYYGEK